MAEKQTKSPGKVNVAIWLPAALLFLIMSFLLFLDKGSIVLWVNARHSPFFDLFFKYYTNLGNGFVFVIIGLGFFFIRYYYVLLTAAIGIFHSLLVNLFKHVLFTDSPRPRAFFHDDSLIHFVDGVTVHSQHSFPSGHTASAFAAALLLAFIAKRTSTRIALLLAAALVGYSRMYLFQHFYEDVFTGMILGLFSATVIWYSGKALPHKAWMDKKLF